MNALRRNHLVRISEAAWDGILDRPWDGQARDCLAHWARHRLPLVVTRQAINAPDVVALGLPAPSRWGRRRLALQVPRAAVIARGEFPLLSEVQAMLPPSARCAVRELVSRLDELDAPARVYGSHGWQAISGLDHLRPGSDLDLSVAVDGVVRADAVSQVLLSTEAAPCRLDGEIVFGDGAAVAWREWIEWRAGRVRAVMVKRLCGVELQRDAGWGRRAEGCNGAEVAELSA